MTGNQVRAGSFCPLSDALTLAEAKQGFALVSSEKSPGWGKISGVADGT
jgi:hypothetical protein